MRPRAVIFDLFGTLVPTFPLQETRRVLAEIAALFGVPADDLLRVWRETTRQRQTGAFPTVEAAIQHACRALGCDPDPDKVSQAAALRLESMRRVLSPRPDALDTLTRVKALGYRVGLTSNCTLEVALVWHEIPLAGLIEMPVFSCTAGAMKPDPRIYAQAYEKLGVSPQECLYVGDGEDDELAGAAALGMRPVLVHVPHERRERDTRPLPGQVPWPSISSLGQVLALLEG